MQKTGIFAGGNHIINVSPSKNMNMSLHRNIMKHLSLLPFIALLLPADAQQLNVLCYET
jgi:hypothetical protein